MSTGKVTWKVEDGVGWMTLDNPDRLNAISLEMWTAAVTPH